LVAATQFVGLPQLTTSCTVPVTDVSAARSPGEDALGGQPDVVKVDVPGLKAMAGEVAEAAAIVGKAYPSRQGELTPTGPATAGWSCVVAAREASTAWGPFVKTLAGSVDGLANEMRTAADSYRESDDAAQRRFPGGPR
jgi:hypothetical protein